MSYDTKKKEAVRKGFTLVEIYCDRNDPALDSTFALEQNSRGTPKTTDNAAAWTGTDFIVYRYADQAISGVDHFPGLVKVTSSIPRIEPGRNIGLRSTASFTIRDFVSDDSFELPDAYSGRAVKDSHLEKLIFSNHLKNRRVRILKGYDPSNFSESNCIIENYILDSHSNPNGSGDVTFKCIDELILVESVKAKAPEISKGELSAAMTDVQTNLDFTSDVTDEYGPVASTGYVKVGKEIMSYTVTSSILLTVVREQLGTESSSHNERDTVQKVKYYDNENIIDIITDLITSYTKIPVSMIPTADWNALKTGDLAGYNLTRPLHKQISVKKLLNELIELAGLSFYNDVVKRSIIIRSNPDFATPIHTFKDSENIIQGSIKVSNAEKNQVTRQTILWDKDDPTESDDEKNYRKALHVINGVVESPADISNVSEGKIIKSDWLNNTLEDNGLATSAVQRKISRFGQIPLEVSFRTDSANVGNVAGGEMWLGSIFNINTSKIIEIINGVKFNKVTTCQAFSIKEDAGSDTYTVVGQSYIAAAPPQADLYIDSDQVDYLLTDHLSVTSAREYVVVIATGVKLSSSVSTIPAFSQGVFFAGATLKIINLGVTCGSGGAGGKGGDVDYDGITFTALNPVAGAAGGNCFEFTTDAILDNGFGQILAGGGGGSGTFGDLVEESPSVFVAYAGNGGGGGQGQVGGGKGLKGVALDFGVDGFDGFDGSVSGYGEGGETGDPLLPLANRGGSFGEAGLNADGVGGGASGLAIKTNGNSVTITAGNNSEQIKGGIV